jgi:hypothetical protein
MEVVFDLVLFYLKLNEIKALRTEFISHQALKLIK